ncbi:MAG: hypothetical protein WD872_13830 [Pirellulaceae bacterium]
MSTKSKRPDAKRPAQPKPKRKRGIILLLVVSLLALFVLIGVTYAVLANRYVEASRITAAKQEYGDHPEREFDLVLSQLVYDTPGNSALRGHSLLGDAFGHDFVFDDASDGNANDDTKFLLPSNWENNQAFAFQVNSQALQANGGTLSPIPDYYSGRILTFTTGPAEGYSGRIMNYEPALSGGPQFVIELDYSSHESFSRPVTTDIFEDRFLINGAPFNGVGGGYDDLTYNMDAVYAHQTAPTTPFNSAVDLASLLPNYSQYDAANARIFVNGGAQQRPVTAVGVGGPDEPWDAADFQTMFLAMQTPNRAREHALGTNLAMLPSYHRPELVHYWRMLIINTILAPSGVATAFEQYQIMAHPYGRDGQRGTADDPTGSLTLDQLDRIYNLTRCSIFRPMPWDHPNFTGSNPNMVGVFDNPAANVQPVLTNGQALFDALVNLNNLPLWDVDNDNDGLADSIWVDPGLPVITSPDGKRYKRLVAIMVQDLDGRINLNAHGNLQQVYRTGAGPTFTYPHRATNPVQGGLMTTTANLPRGLGFGPAEVDFFDILNPSNPPTAAEANFYAAILQSKYASNLPGDSGLAARPGQATVRDTLSVVEHHGMPNDYANQITWYASPPDVWGRGAVVLDYGGQPLMAFMGSPDEMLDNPYELSLSGALNNSDSPYALVEIERMLRYHDPDAQRLPSRVLAMDQAQAPADRRLTNSSPGVIGVDHTRRQLLAGMSSHIPAPAGQIPREWRALLASYPITPGNASILDFYRARLAAPLAQGGGALVEPQLTQVFNTIVPWELRHGGKFDINRWLGDGLDSNGNGVADDPAEALNDPANLGPFQGARERASQVSGFVVNAEHSNGVDANNDGISADTPLNPPLVTPDHKSLDREMSRQLYARHLFCLAMLFVDQNFPNAPLMPVPHEPTLTQPGDIRELYIRRIAQWAVNVVDARDSDAIMTAFEYDVNPWNGWSVDGNLGTDGSTTAEFILGNNVSTNERRLVWGVEQPDLLLNESLAFHSRNVKDTDRAGPGDEKRTDPMSMEEDLDQFRVPQGSLFIELYNPRAYRWNAPVGGPAEGMDKPRLPRELYDDFGNLQLGRLAPGGRPVWRLAISPIIRGDSTFEARHPQTIAGAQPLRGAAFPESGSFDWQDASLLTSGGTVDGPVGTLADFRYAYFGNASALTANELAYSFYNTISSDSTTGAPFLQPGHYAVIGPRTETYLGSVDPSAVSPRLWNETAANSINGYSQQRFILDPTAAPNVMDVFDTNARTSRIFPSPPAPAPPENIRRVVSIVANYTATPMVGAAVWTRPWTQGLNITEPLMRSPGANFYPEPTAPINSPGLPADAGFYDDPDLGQADPAPQAAGTGFRDTPVEGSDAANAGRPIHDAVMQPTGTYEDVSSVYLQRLANPLMPWNPLPTDPTAVGLYNNNLPINPYLTVDWLSLDATVFAGDEDTDELAADGTPIDPDDDPADRPDMGFRSRQRGNHRNPSVLPASVPPVEVSPWSPVTENTTNGVYPVTPAGGAVEPYFQFDLSNDRDNLFDPLVDRHTFGYVNPQVGHPSGGTYVGEAMDRTGQPAPYPWLTHLDRPFANPFELLQVWSSSPSRLFGEVTPGRLTAAIGPDPYDAGNPASLRAPFGHLLNFFHSHTNATDSPQLQRLLDYVEVPSPFTGSERWFNSTQFGTTPPQHLYKPPFNKLSRFRDPGRININTVFDNRVLLSAVSIFPGMIASDFTDKVLLSRQGYVGSVLAAPPAGIPTRFANPFRPADTYDMMPPMIRLSKPVDATFLRPEMPPGDRPLFDHIAVAPGTDAYRNTDRNPYFRYQALQKLGNNFTTQSNCYAVWMTIGYFEVEEHRPLPAMTTVIDVAHPDGYALGQEIGYDTGEIVRHRAFYIIDRSVPVGYGSPGQKLNQDNCVLLRRLIE